MESFNKNLQNNLGGIFYKFQFVDIQDVADMPTVLSGEQFIALENIDLKPGASWKTGYSTIEGLRFNSDPEETGNGDAITKRLSGEIGRSSKQDQANFQSGRFGRYLVLFTESDGTKRLLGTLREPARFNYSYQTGDRPGERKFSFMFYCTDDVPALYVE